jgi:hypothetical protein
MNWEAVIGIVGIVELVASIVMGVGLYLVSRKADRIDLLEKTVTTKAEQVVDAKFALLSAQLHGAIERLSTVIENINSRLARGESTFEKQGDARQRLEVETTAEMGEIKTWCTRTFGTRDQMEKIAESLSELRMAVAGFDAALAAHIGGGA